MEQQESNNDLKNQELTHSLAEEKISERNPKFGNKSTGNPLINVRQSISIILNDIVYVLVE